MNLKNVVQLLQVKFEMSSFTPVTPQERDFGDSGDSPSLPFSPKPITFRMLNVIYITGCLNYFSFRSLNLFLLGTVLGAGI